jgi:transposase
MLEIYKEQGSVERGFRFLKNKSFLVSESYFKKPERIEALAFIMVLCLMIYSLLELKLRRAMKDKELTIPDALNKPTSRPTLQWAFSMFGRIAEVKILVSGVIRKVNLTIIQKCSPIRTILSALGPK